MNKDQPPQSRWIHRTGSEAGAGPADPTGNLQDAAEVARLFCDALLDPGRFRHTLVSLVTPGSREYWGDFGAAAGELRDIPDWDAAPVAEPAPENPEVAYVRIFPAGAAGTTRRSGHPADGAAVVTLVWQDQLGAWLVHAFGQPVDPATAGGTA
ncbi:hypothetical protein [Arthrobacter crystallopoietes]|uniref:Uncharacterized protein n=1 Tax=Crystallibacter crystallopoietes TaxID=37928 RepID=A0A1H1B010_9MICC|nr:hypothetical protein [Arthrobacter crystallopoietes]AUI51339.1 hypothetical protein AC20117_11510 [Arthrobacter crystallopoietes]SDQ45111.1 hypothetical protein SAMN04489742_1165 [Arthrobacter crystallopoietes]